jgi:hypothetical protein
MTVANNSQEDSFVLRIVDLMVRAGDRGNWKRWERLIQIYRDYRTSRLPSK